MPELTEIITAVTDFIADYVIFVAAGGIIGLAAYVFGRFAKAAR